MSRGIPGALATAIAQGTVYPVLFGFFDFAGSGVRVHSHVGDIVWGGYTWTGLGDLVAVETISESKDVRANGLVFTLNGVPSTLIAEVLTNRSRGREATLWFGCFNAAGALVSDPHKLFSGRMDQPMIDDSGETCKVSVSAESRLVDLQRSRERRYTHEDQQIDYPGDLGLEFVAGLQNKEVLWSAGKSSTNPSASAGGAGAASSAGSVYGPRSGNTEQLA